MILSIPAPVIPACVLTHTKLNIVLLWKFPYLRLNFWERATQVDTCTLPLSISLRTPCQRRRCTGTNVKFVLMSQCIVQNYVLIGLLNYYCWQHHIAEAPIRARYTRWHGILPHLTNYGTTGSRKYYLLLPSAGRHWQRTPGSGGSPPQHHIRQVSDYWTFNLFTTA